MNSNVLEFLHTANSKIRAALVSAVLHNGPLDRSINGELNLTAHNIMQSFRLLASIVQELAAALCRFQTLVKIVEEHEGLNVRKWTIYLINLTR